MNDTDPTARRSFLRTVSAGSVFAATAGLGGCANAVAAPLATPQPLRGSSKWDLSWLDRLTAPHRVVFNVTQKGDLALFQAGAWMEGFKQAHDANDADLNAVLVFRHDAVTMLFNDAMWERLALTASNSPPPMSAAASGAATSAAAPAGAAASTASSATAPQVASPRRNPWLGAAAQAPAPDASHGAFTIRGLMSRGVIMIACNNALRGQVGRLKQKEGLSEADADQAIRAAVVPGGYIMPNGIFSVSRAQDAGCAYFTPG